MQGNHHRIHSPQLGRAVHVWTYGSFGWPVLVFPTAAGMAHEWQAHGMIDALSPLLRAGRIKLYCPESNVAEVWTRRDHDLQGRLARHHAYERFILDTLVPAIRADCRSEALPLATAGASLGAMYAANMALKHPETFRWALCLSGRYEVRHFTDGQDDLGVYYNNPLAYVGPMQGEVLDRVRQHTHLELVCGRGRYEEGCIEETLALGDLLAHKGISHRRHLWGHDVSHEWVWWRRQAALYLNERFGA